MIAHTWHNNTFWLTHDRLMYWEETKALIASDLHIGKTGHFRKHGIAMPQALYKNDLIRLFVALQHFKPTQFIVVGDLFHSEANKELDWFTRWRNDLHFIEFILVKGNHDILPQSWYGNNGILLHTTLQSSGISFVHDPFEEAGKRKKASNPKKGEPPASDEPTQALPVISGHLHPGVNVRTGLRQSVTLPCFHFNDMQCVLPAFSHFTGTFNVKPQKEDAVFAIAGQQVMRL